MLPVDGPHAVEADAFRVLVAVIYDAFRMLFVQRAVWEATQVPQARS